MELSWDEQMTAAGRALGAVNHGKQQRHENILVSKLYKHLIEQKVFKISIRTENALEK